MKSEILQRFQGRINTIMFDDEMNYYTTGYILNNIEDLENSLTNAIELADKFEDIYFDYYYIPKDLNERLADGEFTK